MEHNIQSLQTRILLEEIFQEGVEGIRDELSLSKTRNSARCVSEEAVKKKPKQEEEEEEGKPSKKKNRNWTCPRILLNLKRPKQWTRIIIKSNYLKSINTCDEEHPSVSGIISNDFHRTRVEC